jgi:hypothetical protein
LFIHLLQKDQICVTELRRVKQRCCGSCGLNTKLNIPGNDKKLSGNLSRGTSDHAALEYL